MNLLFNDFLSFIFFKVSSEKNFKKGQRQLYNFSTVNLAYLPYGMTIYFYFSIFINIQFVFKIEAAKIITSSSVLFSHLCSLILLTLEFHFYFINLIFFFLKCGTIFKIDFAACILFPNTVTRSTIDEFVQMLAKMSSLLN